MSPLCSILGGITSRSPFRYKPNNLAIEIMRCIAEYGKLQTPPDGDERGLSERDIGRHISKNRREIKVELDKLVGNEFLVCIDPPRDSKRDNECDNDFVLGYFHYIYRLTEEGSSFLYFYLKNFMKSETYNIE